MNKPKKIIHQDLVMAVGLMIVGIAFFVGSFMLPRDANPINNIHTFPMLASGTLILFSVFNIQNGIKKTRKLNEDYVAGTLKSAPEITWEKLKYPVAAAAIILIYAISVAVIGFFVSTAIFLPVSITLMGYRKYWVTACVTIGLEAFIYILFIRVLFMRLPAGLLF